MSSFKRKEPVAVGARRIVCAELESAIQSLSRNTKRDHAAEAAQAIGRARAIVELVGPGLPTDTLRRDRKRFSAIAKTLDNATRGRRLVTRLNKLAKRAGLNNDDAVLKSLRQELDSQSRAKVTLRTRGQRFDPMVYRLVAELAELRGNVGHWPDADPTQTEAPPPGLAGCYRAARSVAGYAQTDPSKLLAAGPAFAFLANAIDTLSKSCPAMLNPQRDLLSAAAKAQAHQQLHARLSEAITSLKEKTKTIEPLIALIDAQQQATLQCIAQTRIHALAETPQAFAKRFEVYWKHWLRA